MSDDSKTVREISYADWEAEGTRIFGEDRKQWRFVCPACGVVTQVQEWLDAGVPDQIAFSCIGRSRTKARDAFDSGPGPCNYAGGGLFGLNPIKVTRSEKDARGEPVVTATFAFAPNPQESP
jgi:hypothetical protein